jgi:hypothetical protein
MFGILGGGILGALLGLFRQPKIPEPPKAPTVDEALSGEADRRDRRRRMSEFGRGSTFLTGGEAGQSQTRRGSDLLNPLGAR